MSSLNIARQLAFGLLTAFGVTTLVFILMRAVPGDPAVIILGDLADLVSEEHIQEVREALGLDKSLWQQYLIFIRSVFTGEFGVSFRTGQPVSQMIGERLPLTIQLAISGFIVGIIIGVPSGIIAAIKHDTWIDKTLIMFSTFGLAAPSFWIGLFLLYIFAYQLGWFPLFGSQQEGTIWEQGAALVLPAITIGYHSAALLARVTRTSMLEVLNAPYIMTARAKGLFENAVILRHGLSNAILPILTIMGINVAYLLGGSVIVEVVFSRPGMGRLLIDGIFARDYPVVQGAILIFALMVVLANMLTDLMYTMLDPRLRSEK